VLAAALVSALLLMMMAATALASDHMRTIVMSNQSSVRQRCVECHG
jgi:hypothetical protein